MQALLDADVSVHDDMQDMSKSSCLFTAAPLTPLTAEKNPRICANLVGRPVGGWGSGPLDPWPAPPLFIPPNS